MGKKYLKKVLSGISIAALVAGSQALAPTAAVAGSASGCSSKKTGAVSTEEQAVPSDDATDEKGSVLNTEKNLMDETAEEAAPQEARGKSG